MTAPDLTAAVIDHEGRRDAERDEWRTQHRTSPRRPWEGVTSDDRDEVDPW